MAAAVFEFGDFRLDFGRFELLRGGRTVKLERKPMELLILLVESKGQLVTRAEIAERLWESEVFVDTEHGINTAIRKIRQVLGDDPEEPRFVQTVTGMGYRFIAPVVAEDSRAADTASPPSVAELPEPETVSPVPSIRKIRPLWIAMFGGGVALILLVVVAAMGPRQLAQRLQRGAKPAITSLAVLPLDNLSGDPNQDYFADGMTDELITMLAKNSTLHVTSRTSVMQYKGVHRPIRDIARELGVDGILEGSITRTGSQAHMTIQLIQAPTDTHLWAESYDRDANDMVSLPREAALAIAKRLGSATAASSTPRYVNSAAHDAYLRGHYLWYADQNDKAFEYFKKATELQPDYAPGWSGLANYYGAGAVDGILDPAASLGPEEVAAHKAVELDDTFPEAHLAVCASYLIDHWDWTRADPECLRAIQLDPDFAEAHHFRAKIFAALNRHAEAIEEQKKAMELDPFGRPWALAYSYLLARQFDAALLDARQRLETARDDQGSHWILGEIYRGKGMYKESTEELAKVYLLQGLPKSAAAVKRVFQQGGYTAVVRWQLSDAQEASKSHYVSPGDLARLHAQVGEREEAISLLEKAYRERAPMMLWVQDEPAYDFLHSDPRYRSIIQRIGLPPAY